MDNTIQATHHVFSEQTVSVDANNGISPVSNKHNAANGNNVKKNRSREHQTFKSPYVFVYFLILNAVSIDVC